MAECISMCEALGSIPSKTKKSFLIILWINWAVILDVVSSPGVGWYRIAFRGRRVGRLLVQELSLNNPILLPTAWQSSSGCFTRSSQFSKEQEEKTDPSA